ncbi:MAG TPA: phosphoribosylglycinamide formyltransferase [Clostridiales bacterium]|jgi:phosphoribosylglycinamide formyltransferase-1|nr:phosphoribosylglycinamide formyltransferase [Clostridiales bacterium]
MLRIAVIVSGGGTNLQALIDRMERKELGDVNIEVVISNRKDAYALERAKKHGIATATIIKKDYANQQEFEEAFMAILEQYKVNFIVLAGCLMMIPESIVNRYENRIINIHPSLIPSFCGDGYYGLKVHEAALKRGVKITGATVHFVDAGCDTGPIILQKAVPVYQEDTPEILQKRVMEQAEWEILPKAVRMIADGLVKVENEKVRILK